MNKLQYYKEEIDRVNLEIQQAERDYDLNRWVLRGWGLWRARLCVCEKEWSGMDGIDSWVGYEKVGGCWLKTLSSPLAHYL